MEGKKNFGERRVNDASKLATGVEEFLLLSRLECCRFLRNGHSFTHCCCSRQAVKSWRDIYSYILKIIDMSKGAMPCQPAGANN